MASLRIPSLRHLSRYSLSPARSVNQRRWAQVHDVRFLVTQPSQAVLDKYRTKLDEKAKQEGLGSIEDLKAAYGDKISQLRRQDAVEFPSVIPQAPETPVAQPNRGPLPDGELLYSSKKNETEPKQTPGETTIPQAPDTPVTQPNRGPLPESELRVPKANDGVESIPQAPGTTVKQPNASRVPPVGDKPAIKTLDDIINLEKVSQLPEQELTAIWRLRHASSPQNICAVVPAAAYRAMERAARSAPQFVLPVPHEGQGAEMHFLQWTFDAPSRTATVLFTQLAEFKTRGEFAQPHTTVTHHLDLADDRGLVLMQGYVMEGRGVTTDQAKWLLMCLQRFYGGWEGAESELTGERKTRAEERKKLLDWFATGDERFTVDKLMEEAERMG
jgi:ATP synthase mitochondrial F1 complex assembly factor 1